MNTTLMRNHMALDMNGQKALFNNKNNGRPKILGFIRIQKIHSRKRNLRLRGLSLIQILEPESEPEFGFEYEFRPTFPLRLRFKLRIMKFNSK